MSKRQYCPKCLYPQSVCLCEAVKPIDNQTNIVVLQHPSEVKQAKNTVRLISLGLTHCEVIIGETETDFAQIKRRCTNNTGQYRVLYPNDNSLELDQRKAQLVATNNLILLDGTWKKAYKIWQLNPWLHALPSYHFSNPPSSIYQRKAKLGQSLSTLEACAYALDLIEKIGSEPLLQLLKTRQDKGF